MATNKRTLKKEIRMICGALAGECVVAELTVPGIDKNKLNEIILDVADLQYNAIRLMNVAFPNAVSSFATRREYNVEKSKYFKAAFRQLKGQFNAKIEEILKKMNAALPAEYKEANRKRVAE
ncbi:MAG: hypothetical protein J1E29_03450 [Duncaniella sp.]|nr:hypothetical protein [Duncaniella sp.]